MSALVELISPAALMQGVIMNTHITVYCARGVRVLAALSSALALALPPLLHVLYFIHVHVYIVNVHSHIT